MLAYGSTSLRKTSSETDSLVASGARLETALEGAPGRENRRRELMASFGALWSLSAETLSLSSILHRAREAGADVARLEAVRDELRGIVEDVARRSRLC